MKHAIHPTWHTNCKVTCACGNTFEVGSTFESLQVDICSACHPFFTGEMKFVDTQGRVDKFMQKVERAKAKQQKSKGKKSTQQTQTGPQKSYKQLLEEQKTALKKQQKAA